MGFLKKVCFTNVPNIDIITWEKPTVGLLEKIMFFVRLSINEIWLALKADLNGFYRWIVERLGTIGQMMTVLIYQKQHT